MTKVYKAKSSVTRAARKLLEGVEGASFTVVEGEEGFTYKVSLPEDTCPRCFATPDEGVHTVASIADASPEAAAKMELSHTCLQCGEDFGTPIKRKTVKRISDIENPCSVVWDIAAEMPGARRKDVIEACVKAGVAFYTARTQYQLWKQAGKASEAS